MKTSIYDFYRFVNLAIIIIIPFQFVNEGLRHLTSLLRVLPVLVIC